MKYTEEFKQSVIARYASRNESVASILKDTGVSRSTLYSWINEKNVQTHNKTSSFSAVNYHRLQQTNEHLVSVISVLKESHCSIDSPLKQKLCEIDRLYDKYNLHVLCDAFDVSRGTYYNHMKRSKGDDAWFIKRRKELTPYILEVFYEGKQTYGGDTIAAILRQRGIHTSGKVVREIMKEQGISCMRMGGKHIYEIKEDAYSNHVKRNFKTDAPNKVWVSDVTYYRFKGKPYYICVVLDLFSRRVLSYKISKRNSTALVKMTIKAAYLDRQPESGLIFHSDRGSNYTCNTIREYLSNLGITQSFSKPGNPYDNAAMESFFSNLKKDELYRKDYKSEEQLKACIKEYIYFYNNNRVSRLQQYKTPIRIEEEFLSKHADSRNI